MELNNNNNNNNISIFIIMLIIIIHYRLRLKTYKLRKLKPFQVKTLIKLNKLKIKLIKFRPIPINSIILKKGNKLQSIMKIMKVLKLLRKKLIKSKDPFNSLPANSNNNKSQIIIQKVIIMSNKILIIIDSLLNKIKKR
jgi:hypothetical protein